MEVATVQASPRQLVGQHDRVSRLPALTADSLGTMRRTLSWSPDWSLEGNSGAGGRDAVGWVADVILRAVTLARRRPTAGAGPRPS